RARGALARLVGRVGGKRRGENRVRAEHGLPRAASHRRSHDAGSGLPEGYRRDLMSVFGGATASDHLAPLAGRGVGRHRRPFLLEERRSEASATAKRRVRGLSTDALAETPPHPTLSPQAGRGSAPSKRLRLGFRYRPLAPAERK